ncbi:MAG: DNA polymerase III subunit epsilon [Betaproteobacteria bacterium]|nr:DNA polymerase III subunit epsilon [Betaproteobacteria bacterium]
MRQVFLDTETTGLYADQGDRVIEIACVEMVNRKLTGRHFHRYVNPERDSHEEALRIHGITSEFLADKPLFAAVAQELLDFVRGAELVIHNAAFDLGFLNAELARLQLPAITTHAARVLDTLALAKEMFPAKRNNLDALCDRLEVDRSGRTLHGALLDAELLAEVYINMTRGQNSLMIDIETPAQRSGPALASDFSGLDLPVLWATPHDIAAHETILTELDKASGGKTVWPR